MIFFRNEVGLGKRIKKRFRKVWCCHMFSCFRANRKNPCQSCESGPLVNSEGTTATTDNLQILVETLQNQTKDRSFQVLLYLTTILEQFPRPCVPFTPTAKCSQCKLKIDDSLSLAKFSTPSLLPAQSLDRSVSAVYPKGDFGFGLLHRLFQDKAVQSSLEHSSRSGFDVADFKIKLITHMRSLRQDLVTLRQLLFSTEECYNWRPFDKALCTPDQSRRQFYKAKARAYNFVKFYKLRKVNDKKRHARMRTNV